MRFQPPATEIVDCKVDDQIRFVCPSITTYNVSDRASRMFVVLLIREREIRFRKIGPQYLGESTWLIICCGNEVNRELGVTVRVPDPYSQFNGIEPPLVEVDHRPMDRLRWSAPEEIQRALGAGFLYPVTLNVSHSSLTDRMGKDGYLKDKPSFCLCFFQ